MVSKQTLPDFAFTMHAILVILSTCLQSVLSSNVQYCWKGTEDDHTGWLNISCATGNTYIPHAMSLEHYGPTTAPSTDHIKKYYCMVFTFYEESKSNNITTQILRAVYDCDNSFCKVNHDENSKVTYNGKEGFLNCCDSGDNCNTHQLIHQRQVQHSCYRGELSTKTLHIETCPQQKSHCVLVRDKQVSPEKATIETVNEKFFCDTNNEVCGSFNMDEVQGQSCKENTFDDSSGNSMERETCCCKDNLCYKPSWVEDANIDQVTTRTNNQSTWQQTLLIIIGVALGILVVSAAVFIVIRFVRNKEKSDNFPRAQYDKTAYQSVQSSHSTEEDTVQILPDPYV